MDRVILGKAPANTQPYYHRDNEYGLFISKPGANVYNCADGDLIFDSTKPSLMQPIGRGAANIPKAVYEKGLFGEEGVINDGNWDSPGSGPEELNADTSWAFDALKKVYSEVQDMKNNTFGDMDSSEGSYGGPPLYETNVNMESAKFQQFIRFTNDYKQRDPFKTTFKDFPDIGADEFVRTMIKDIWRIYDVFPTSIRWVLEALLPSWRPSLAFSGETVFYFNQHRRHTQTDHPLLACASSSILLIYSTVLF